jgi:hypothetical protein
MILSPVLELSWRGRFCRHHCTLESLFQAVDELVPSHQGEWPSRPFGRAVHFQSARDTLSARSGENDIHGCTGYLRIVSGRPVSNMTDRWGQGVVAEAFTEFSTSLLRTNCIWGAPPLIQTPSAGLRN